MTKVTHEFDLYGRHCTHEAGELAKQATGACIVKVRRFHRTSHCSGFQGA